MLHTIRSNGGIVIVILVILVLILVEVSKKNMTGAANIQVSREEVSTWIPPSLYYDPSEGEDRKLLVYGQELIANTSRYFGPHGIIAGVTNGMNCQNCHLHAGRKNWGNNYSQVNANYPRYRERSGTVESIYKRVSDCFERSLNGKAPDSNSYEFKAIEAYIKWVGKDVKKGQVLPGSGIEMLPLMDRAADPAKGQLVYKTHCETCHGSEGQGQFTSDRQQYVYPPLWGDHSYNTGAGLYRISRLAGYVKNNMPFNKASHSNSILTNEEAWDVAAYINSQPRPVMDLTGDWPDLSKKPFDHPFGPYADEFSELQHKYGPFKPILAKQKK
jgi:thiosulfate dehydrogenase